MTIFSEKLFRQWKPERTNVPPKKGMLVRHAREAYDWVNKKEAPWVLIVSSIVDEYNYCKFEFLSDTKTEWTDWITVEKFNSSYEIKNPWI